MKYCIGCKHLYFQPKEYVQGSSWTGAYVDEEAAMFCSKGYWSQFLPTEPGDVGIDFERAMETAQNCTDYTERS